MNKKMSFHFTSGFTINGKNYKTSNLDSQQNLTPQQEYWLNRILRDYGNKIFLLVLLFFVLMFAVVLVSWNSGRSDSQRNSQIDIKITN
jgi:hypothetical protein